MLFTAESQFRLGRGDVSNNVGSNASASAAFDGGGITIRVYLINTEHPCTVLYTSPD